MLWINTIGTGILGIWSTGELLNLRALANILWLPLPFPPLIDGVNDIYDRRTLLTNLFAFLEANREGRNSVVTVAFGNDDNRESGGSTRSDCI